MSYQLLPRGVLRLADGLTVTRDMVEWEGYRAWLKAGGTLEPMPAPPGPPAPTPAEVTAQLTLAVQAHLDATARERNYDGILSAATYATSTNSRFAAEGQAAVTWRDEVWVTCYAIMADVLAGRRAVPTAADVIAELPAIAWPVVP